MTQLRTFLMQSNERIFQRVTDSTALRVLQLVAVIALPGWFLFWSWNNLAWLRGVSALYHGHSIYVFNQSGASFYPYLPSFGLLNGAIAYPVHVLLTWVTDSATYSHWFPYLWAVITNSWAYLSLLGIPYVAGSLFDDEQTQRRAVIVLLALPALWVELIGGFPNSLVALCALLSISFAVRRHWFLAAVAIGFATFKFTGLPMALALFVYAALAGGRSPAVKVIAGGIVSQLPNLLYFAVFPDDLLMIIRRGGSLSYWAGTALESNLSMTVLDSIGLFHAYSEVFPVVVICFGLVGGIVAARSVAGLPAGYAVGYASTSLLIPAEQRLVPLAVLLSVLLIPLLHDRVAQFALASMFALSGYWFVASRSGYGVFLGAFTVEWEFGAILLSYLLQVTLGVVLVFLLVRYRRDETAAWSVSHPSTRPHPFRAD